MIPPLMVVVKHFSTLQGNFFLAFSRSLCYAINERGENNMWLDAIRNMKSKSGLTTAEIAMQSGIPEPTLEKLFAGKVKDPKLPTLQKLVRFFGYTLDDLDDPAPETKKPPAPAEASTGEISLEESNALLVALGYIEPGEQISDDDLAFLGHVIGLLDAWFDKGR